MNYAKLQQDVNRLLANIFAWIEFIPTFVSMTAQDVSITLEDENGVEHTTSHWNIRKMYNYILGAVSGEMEQVLYVDSDAVSGDGTLNSPFGTIKEAVESTPNGSNVYIYISGGKTYYIDENVYMGSRNIDLVKKDGEDPTLHFKLDTTYVNDTLCRYFFFDRNGGRLSTAYINFDSDDLPEGKQPIVSMLSGHVDSRAGSSSIIRYGKTENKGVPLYSQSGVSTFASIAFYSHDITHHTNAKGIFYARTGSFNWYSGTVTNSDGTGGAIKDLVIAPLKNSDGDVINYLSNIDLR